MELKHNFRQAHEVMAKSKRLLAICHRNPDADTLGSAAACLLWCKRQGIDAHAFCVDVLPDHFAFLPEYDRFTDDKKIFQKHWDAVVVFDSGDLKHAGAEELLDSMRPRPTVLAIDHHYTNKNYADINIINPKASSASELMHGFFSENNIQIDSDLATCLLAGIVNDTDSLTNPAASRPAFQVAADLMSKGANWRTLVGLFVKNRPINTLRLMGQAMSRLKFDKETSLASTVIFLDDCPEGVKDCHMDGFANFLGNTLNVDVILVLKDMGNNRVEGSFRTAGEADVSAVAKRLGGGGHRKASGFSTPGKVIEKEHGWVVVEK